jgi:cytochrome d ubiquinol oxidase subunit I
VLLLQLISADDTAKGVAKNQPIKLAAMEGIYETKPYTPIGLFGWVDAKEERVKGLQIPGGLSFLTYQDVKKPVPGLLEFPREEWPNVPVVFQVYHLMVLMWVFMVFAVIAALFFWKKKKLEGAKWTLRLLVCSVIFPQIANQAGWCTAEIGRQPWIVYKILRTVDGVSSSIQSSQVFGSILMFILIYLLLFALFIYLLDQKIKHGPEGEIPSEYRNFFNRQKGKKA